MKRFLTLAAVVAAICSAGCASNNCNPCRQGLFGWGLFNGGLFNRNGNGGDCCSTPSPCSSNVHYGSGEVIQDGGTWVPRSTTGYTEGELVRPGPMEVGPRG